MEYRSRIHCAVDCHCRPNLIAFFSRKYVHCNQIVCSLCKLIYRPRLHDCTYVLQTIGQFRLFTLTTDPNIRSVVAVTVKVLIIDLTFAYVVSCRSTGDLDDWELIVKTKWTA